MLKPRVVVVALVALVGCGEVATIEATPEATPDATGEDPVVVSPKEEIAPLVAWSFEPASADCNGWPTVGTAGIRAAPGRTGAYSCKVCATAGAGIGLGRAVERVGAGRYLLRAWIRARASSAAPREVSAQIEAATSRGKTEVASSPIAVLSEWVAIESIIELNDESSDLNIVIRAPTAAPEECLLVDDVTLERAP